MLEINEIKRLIAEDIASEKKRLAAVGQKYYEGDHDIKQYRQFYVDSDGVLVEDKIRSNERIVHPFFTELADQLTAYILSGSDNFIKAKETAEGLQDLLNEYFDEDFWSEAADLLTGAYTKGFEYLYAYKNADDKIAFQCADSMGVVEVRAKDTDDGCQCFIYWYIDRIEKNKKQITRIQVHDDKQIYFYVQSGNGKIELDKDEPINPRPNVIYKDTATGAKYGAALGFIPFFRLDYTKKQFSGLKPVKALIDDYDLMQCGLSNNLQDFDHPIMLVKGFEGDNLDELQINTRTKKLVGVGEHGDLDLKTVDVPYQARKTKADEDEKNIYRFGMGLNTMGLKDTNSTTNIAIKAAYTLLDLKADKFEKRFKKFLKQIIEVVLDEINAANGTDYQLKDISFDFPHQMLINEQETVQNEKTKAETQQILLDSVLSAATMIGDEDTLKVICEILELDFDEIKRKLEAQPTPDDTGNAKNILDGIVPEDEEDPEQEEGDVE